MSEERCRCDGVELNGSDHCPECGCEQFEERCPVEPEVLCRCGRELTKDEADENGLCDDCRWTYMGEYD